MLGFFHGGAPTVALRRWDARYTQVGIAVIAMISVTSYTASLTRLFVDDVATSRSAELTLAEVAHRNMTVCAQSVVIAPLMRKLLYTTHPELYQHIDAAVKDCGSSRTAVFDAFIRGESDAALVYDEDLQV